MKLSELIEQTLCEIAAGVKSAVGKSRSTMAIAPATLNGKHVGEISYIEFDVSILVEEATVNSSSSEKKIGGQIKVVSVAGIEGGGSKQAESNNSSSAKLSHRVAFKVPICMSADYKS